MSISHVCEIKFANTTLIFVVARLMNGAKLKRQLSTFSPIHVDDGGKGMVSSTNVNVLTSNNTVANDHLRVNGEFQLKVEGAVSP